MRILELHRSGSDIEVTIKDIRTDEIVLKTLWFVDVIECVYERYIDILVNLQQLLALMSPKVSALTTNDRELKSQIKEVSNIRLHVLQY